MICGGTYRVAGHHESYYEPLRVLWFCDTHHKVWHKARRDSYLELFALKALVDRAGRKAVAAKIDMPYQTLSHKLGGFSPLFDDEKKKIISALEEVAKSPKE